MREITAFGRMFAMVPPEALTDDVMADMYGRLRTYHGQLAAGGYDLDSIPAPPDEARCVSIERQTTSPASD